MLNENIKALRKKKGLSQEELANRLHVVRQTISKWEKSLSVPDAEMLVRIAEELDSSTAALLGEPVREEESAETLESLAEQLAELNDHYTRAQQKRRKHWRILCIVLILCAGIGMVSSIVALLYGWYANAILAADSTVIGGADAATHIYLSSVAPQWLTLLTALAIITLAAIGLKKTRS